MSAGSKRPLKVDKFEITSNSNGKTFDISRGDPDNGVPGKTPRIEYRESVFTPFVEITTVIVDQGTAVSDDGDGYTSVMEGLEIEGGEVVKFKITDGTGRSLDLSGNDDLRLQQPGITMQAYKGTQTTLTIVSKEVLDNTLLKNNVTEKLEGKISDVVSRILANNLRSGKTRQIDETIEGVNNEFGESRRPFDIILDLQPLAVPSSVSGISNTQGKCAGYLFWQTALAFYFKSLDGIFSGTEVGRFIFNNRPLDLPSGFDDKILDYTIERGVDVLKNLEMGTYATEMHVWDEYTNEYNTDLRLISPTDGNGTTAGESLPMSSSEYFSEPSLRLKSEIPYGYFQLSDDIKTQTEKSTQPAFSVGNTLQQSTQNFRQKFTIAAEITIPCNLSLHAGDLIYCEFPEISQKRTLRRNRRNSGIYMISDLCHFSNTTQAYTKLRLVRDSFGVR